MVRILTWHEKDVVGSSRIGPTYYMEKAYQPVAVRLHAEKSSPDGNLEVDIFDDGVSIFSNRSASHLSSSTTVGPTVTYDTPVTTISLSKDQNEEELAERFTGDNIDEGSWVHCEVVNLRGGKNVSVHLELESLDE